ncbi:MAG: hypothetical protein K5696_07595 [Lachnospiraceae bacterium]|nr:hypothetical protein [Lachnospiraceae bacterium]
MWSLVYNDVFVLNNTVNRMEDLSGQHDMYYRMFVDTPALYDFTREFS